MKLNIIYEKGTSQKVKKWVNKNLALFQEDFVSAGFIDKPITFEVTETEKDISLTYEYAGLNPNQVPIFRTNARNLIEKKDITLFLYYNTFKVTTGYVAPQAHWGYDIAEIPYNNYLDTYALAHELMHLLCFNLSDRGFIPRGISDNMDITVVNGKLTTYYHNNNPLHPDGNFARTFKHLKPYLQYLDTNESKNSIINTIKNQILLLQDQLAKKQAIPQSWKYFTPDEKTGSVGTIADLDIKLVDMLDKAREKAGIPFVITSGFRTPEHNKKVGGVANSSHLSGLAVDIRAVSGEDKFKIVRALMEVGFERIGVSWKNNFVHCDIDSTKPKTLYTY